jgi:hypothetical protein
VNHRVPRRIALLITGELRVSDLDSQRELRLESGASSFVLTLENEPGESFVRGRLKLLRDGTTFPIQSNLALLELLTSLLDGDAGTQSHED